MPHRESIGTTRLNFAISFKGWARRTEKLMQWWCKMKWQVNESIFPNTFPKISLPLGGYSGDESAIAWLHGGPVLPKATYTISRISLGPRVPKGFWWRHWAALKWFSPCLDQSVMEAGCVLQHYLGCVHSDHQWSKKMYLQRSSIRTESQG